MSNSLSRQRFNAGQTVQQWSNRRPSARGFPVRNRCHERGSGPYRARTIATAVGAAHLPGQAGQPGCGLPIRSVSPTLPNSPIGAAGQL
jgi:hypothetical protein